VCKILRKFDINNLYACPPYLYSVTTLPWELQKSHFSTVLFIQALDYLRYLRRNKLQLLYCSLSVYLLLFTLHIICVALWSVFISLVSYFQSRANANPQRALFRVTNIWRNATLPAVRCKSFTFYKVV